MRAYGEVRDDPLNDVKWEILKVSPIFPIYRFKFFVFQTKLNRCSAAFDLLELTMDLIYEANVPFDHRLRARN